MNTLTAAALGDDPGRWPLPPACGVEERWLRAVAAGGQGRYAAACTELDAIDRSARGGWVRSLAASTRASFLRQLGWHAAARPWDGRALALAGSHPEACADALIGLAADSLGDGRFAVAERLLTRAAHVVETGGSARLPVRQAWVSAELAMATGRGADAVRHAETAVTLAGDLGSARHVVKSSVVHAAALCCAGALDDARRVADSALDVTEATGLVPLSWALACLLGDIGSASRGTDDIAAIRSRSATLVRDRGGAWSNR